MYDFQSIPRYQRLIQRIQRLSPDQKAILDTSMVDETFGSDQMRRKLWALRMQADKDYRDKSLSLIKRGNDLRYEFGKERLGEERHAGKVGSLISAGTIPLSAYFGYKGMRAAQEEAASNRELTKLIKKKLGATP